MSGENQSILRGDEPSSARLVATLGLAGLLSGLIIVSVFEATLPAITAYKAKVLREAVFEVLPGTVQMQRLVFSDGQMIVKEDEEALFGGYDAQGRLMGYAIPSSGPGFQDTIRLIYGYLPAKRLVVGMEILESRETPGLGDKIYKDAAFVANFRTLSVDPKIMTVKKGTKSAPHEVDAITGATISSKAVVRIINEGNARWLERLPGPDEAPPFQAKPDDAEQPNPSAPPTELPLPPGERAGEMGSKRQATERLPNLQPGQKTDHRGNHA